MHVGVLILASRGSAVPEAVVKAARGYGFDVLASNEASARSAADAQPSNGVPARSAADARPINGGSVGYAAGVRRGLSRAAAEGFSHLITLDIDRQHSPDDLPRLCRAIDENPAAVINGVRQLPPGKLPLGVRVARANGDLWIGLAMGRWVRDSGSGLRAYPLAAVVDLNSRSIGREFDVEILVKAAWTDAKIVQVPVSIASPFCTQVMTPLEFLRYGRLITRVMFERLVIPGPVLAKMIAGQAGRLPWAARLRQVATEAMAYHRDRPARFAAAVGVGLFWGIAPAWGFQLILAAATAHALRVSKAVALAASTVSSPITIPFILYGSLLLGRWLCGHPLAGLPKLADMHRSVPIQYLTDYLLGSVAMAFAAAAVGFAATYLGAKVAKSRSE